MAPRQRIGPALGAVLEGLKLARREFEGSTADPPRQRWVPVALVSALQAGLVAALSGYESAGEGDVTDPAQPDRTAPVALLLRRARSTEYLNPPELLELPGRTVRDIETLVTARNAVLHGPDVSEIPVRNDAYHSVLQVLQQVCLMHPAFPVEEHGILLALIRDEISAFERALAGTG
ncbi:hypothetical protein [Hyphomonas jannaschiana]|uniref:RiboL-PSP-HEPN domain-containing protein n=1 Tax=Hyphomonas jannaschiana VP2 TaxID=1280952 RepID=A0A059F7S0_9PROT|nr:hypothetical protein [Hyphomonas jannaschiana]KCZ86652.1 hypothetical protein HJA_14915 [Hyphomonas jannaschiana VP2]